MEPVLAHNIGNNTSEDKLEWNVQGVTDSHNHPTEGFQYQVAWTGYDEQTWEPPANLIHSPDAVDAFHHSCPDKPRPEAQEFTRCSQQPTYN